MRVFLAVKIPEEVKQYILNVQNELLHLGSMTFPLSFHLTLHFFGEISEKQVKDIKEKLSRLVFRKFAVSLGRIGTFPDKKSARVIWLGIEPKDEMVALHNKVMETLSLNADKDFRPHITLARVKHAEQELWPVLEKIHVEKKSFPVASVSLFRSTLTQRKPVYEVIANYSLS
jgi:RNA 2',3'-cyclic 3'-phosphodiesterase